MQTSFFHSKAEKCFGGELLKGRRKSARPLSTKHAIHIIFRARQSTLRRHQRIIEETWNRFAQKFGVKGYQLAVCSNHLHAVVRIHSRSLYKQFAQAFAGTIARKFKISWEFRPYTRLVNWGRDFKGACLYVLQNLNEATGEVPYKPRTQTRTQSRKKPPP